MGRISTNVSAVDSSFICCPILTASGHHWYRVTTSLSAVIIQLVDSLTSIHAHRSSLYRYQEEQYSILTQRLRWVTSLTPAIHFSAGPFIHQQGQSTLPSSPCQIPLQQDALNMLKITWRWMDKFRMTLNCLSASDRKRRLISQIGVSGHLGGLGTNCANFSSKFTSQSWDPDWHYDHLYLSIISPLLPFEMVLRLSIGLGCNRCWWMFAYLLDDMFIRGHWASVTAPSRPVWQFYSHEHNYVNLRVGSSL